MADGSEQAWGLFHRAGVAEGSDARIEFFFDRGGDAELAAFLGERPGYEVKTDSSRYGVTGLTGPMMLNPYSP